MTVRPRRLLLLLAALSLLALPEVRAQQALDVSLQSIAALDAQLQARRAFLAQQQTQRESVTERLGTLPELRRELGRTLARDVRALYRLQRGGLLPIAGGLDSLMSHASRVRHFERLTQRTLKRLTEARRGSAELEREASELELQIAATEEQLASLELAKAALTRDVAVEPELPVVTDVSPPTMPGTLGSGLTFSDEKPAQRELGERFSAQRGQLALPIAGTASIESTTRPDGGGTALRLTGTSGSSVRAAGAGRVVLVERNDDYGLFVIVEHDPRYRTVYGNLGSVEVQQGDAISKSARLGAVGSTPIYFELRRGRRSQDARAWLGL